MGKRGAFRGLLARKEVQAAVESRVRFWKEVESRDPQIKQYRTLTQRAISQDNIAKDSYSKLLSEGVTQPELVEWLIGIAISLRTKGKTPNWLLGLGKKLLHRRIAVRR